MIDERDVLERRSAQVWSEILVDVASHVRGIVISAPPGAGKTRMVEDLSLAMVYGTGETVCVAATTVAQVADIARRIASATLADVTIYGASGASIPDGLDELGVEWTSNAKAATQALRAGRVVVCSVAKLAATGSLHDQADWLIVDEAWQVPDYVAASVTGVGRHLVLIGDSGQIPPVVRVDTSRWADAADGPHLAAPVALRARFGDEVASHRLVASRRVPTSTAAVLGPIFYPECPFGSLSPLASLQWKSARTSASGGSGGVLLDRLGSGSSLMMAQCAGGPTPVATERAVVDACVNVVREISSCGPLRVDNGGVATPIGSEGIGVVCPRVHQVAAVRAGLAHVGLGTVRVETAERWQGLEREIMVALHPASSAGESGRFGLDAGRMCVMTSRHRLACVVVADDRVEASITGAASSGRILTSGADEETRGWVSHLALIDALRERGDVIAI